MRKIDFVNTIDRVSWWSWKLQDIASEIVERIDADEITNDYTLFDALLDAFDNECIYYYQQWEIIENYASPEDVIMGRCNDIYEEFLNDLYEALEFYDVEEDDEDEDEA